MLEIMTNFNTRVSLDEIFEQTKTVGCEGNPVNLTIFDTKEGPSDSRYNSNCSSQDFHESGVMYHKLTSP